MRHRGDLHRGLEPGPSGPAALRGPGRGNPYPCRFGSGELLFSELLPSAALLVSPPVVSLSFLD